MKYNPIFKVHETDRFWVSEVKWGSAAGRTFFVEKKNPQAEQEVVSLAIDAILQAGRDICGYQL